MLDQQALHDLDFLRELTEALPKVNQQYQHRNQQHQSDQQAGVYERHFGLPVPWYGLI